MKKEQKKVLGLVVIAALVAVCLFAPELVLAGDLEPSAPPGSTMKTLDQIPPTWSQIIPASERFELVMEGAAVLDKETGLVWSNHASYWGGNKKIWRQAIWSFKDMVRGGRMGWRLPTAEELASLVDTTEWGPTLPSGHPFILVKSDEGDYYWTSSEVEDMSSKAWCLGMRYGEVIQCDKMTPNYMWPVRGGNR